MSDIMSRGGSNPWSWDARLARAPEVLARGGAAPIMGPEPFGPPRLGAPPFGSPQRAAWELARPGPSTPLPQRTPLSARIRAGQFGQRGATGLPGAMSRPHAPYQVAGETYATWPPQPSSAAQGRTATGQFTSATQGDRVRAAAGGGGRQGGVASRLRGAQMRLGGTPGQGPRATARGLFSRANLPWAGRTGMSRVTGTLGRALGGLTVASAGLPMTQSENPFEQSLGFGMLAGGGTGAAFGPLPGTIAGLGVGAGNLGARALGSVLPDTQVGPFDLGALDEGLSSLVGLGGGEEAGFTRETQTTFHTALDELGLNERERELAIDSVNAIAAETGFEEDGMAAIRDVVGRIREAQLMDEITADTQAQAMANQAALRSYFSGIGNRMVSGAQRNVAVAEEMAAGLPPAQAQALVANAQDRLGRAEQTSAAYMAQAALSPQIQAIQQQQQELEQLAAQIQQRGYQAVLEGTGPVSSELLTAPEPDAATPDATAEDPFAR